MWFKRVAVVGVLFAFALPPSILAQGDSSSGRQAAETCLGCHGIANYKNVYPTYNVPRICGQNYQYILDALAAYANGDRPHETMHAQAATLSDKDLQDIATFFSDAGACGKGG